MSGTEHDGQREHTAVTQEAGRPDGPSWFYPASAAQQELTPVLPAMDAGAVHAELADRLAALGIGHTVELVHGRAADGVLVRSRYAEPVTVVDDEGRFALVARASDGSPKVIDTELAASAPVEQLALYLAFHSLWAMKRLLDRHGAEAVARRTPELLTHQQLVLAFIAASIASADDTVRGYASALMGNATSMLRA
ncbi:MAG: hypothetical protein HY996_00430 [Micrococcales bacterium]|nr:hypothetical protein [Micrococcales bacterium]